MSLTLLSSLLVVVAIYDAFDCETTGAIATDDVTAATDGTTNNNADADTDAGIDAGIDGKVQSSSDGLSSLLSGGMFDNAKDDDGCCCF